MLSRVADSLYWMSRYLERAEHTARVLDVNVVLMLDQPPDFASARWERLLASLGAAPPEESVSNAHDITLALAFDRENKASILACLQQARDNARQVREQISSEMWEQINHLYLQVSRRGTDDIWNAQPHAFFRSVKEGIHLFQGLTDATMNQGEGWQFMEAGRFLERAANGTALLGVHFGEPAGQQERPSGVSAYLDWTGLLKSRTAFEAYCQEYTADLRPDRILEFLLLNAEFPQSIHFSVARLQAALRAIARSAGGRGEAEIERLAGRLYATLGYAQIDEILAGDLQSFLRGIQRQCAQIHAALHRLYLAPPLESVLAASAA